MSLSNAPLHKRYNVIDSLRYIRNRYIGMKGKFSRQLKVLQSDEDFLDRCAKWYEEGYKDWHILSAILNQMMHLEGMRRNLDLTTKWGSEQYRKLPDEMKTLVFPPSHFSNEEMERAFQLHALTCLQTYGFEGRTAQIDMNAVIRFLRNRMRHFDHDIPHAQMFARPPAAWPKM